MKLLPSYGHILLVMNTSVYENIASILLPKMYQLDDIMTNSHWPSVISFSLHFFAMVVRSH